MHGTHVCPLVRENMDASEEDRLTDEELTGQVS
jgi:hypothetical protein